MRKALDLPKFFSPMPQKHNFAKVFYYTVFDKEVNAQKESLKNTSRVHASSHKPTKKCGMKMKQRNNNNVCVKILLMEGSTL